MPTRPIHQVDAFADRPFTGNPAAVCILPAPAPEAWMQAVAREMNLSETAFLHPLAGGTGFRLRWFTPAVEVGLCGHATLASAHILWEVGALAPEAPAIFQTASGELRARRLASGAIELDFPARPVRPAPIPAPLLAALRIATGGGGECAEGFLVEVENDAEVRAARPDFAALARFPVTGVILTARSSTPEQDFVSRFFAPAVGIDEDPVTGAAHCSLGPYWSGRLGRPELAAYQASARGGRLLVRTAGERVFLTGRAVTVLRGDWLA